MRTASAPERHECFVGLAYIAEHGLPGYPAPRPEPAPPFFDDVTERDVFGVASVAGGAGLHLPLDKDRPWRPREDPDAPELDDEGEA